jgi:hypothetical protein
MTVEIHNGCRVVLTFDGRKPYAMSIATARQLVGQLLLLLPELRHDVLDWLEKDDTKAAIEYVDARLTGKQIEGQVEKLEGGHGS